MSETIDFRVSAGLPDNPKWMRLGAKLGPGGLVALITFWAWVRANRSNGNVSGLGPPEIEHAARWRGKRGAFHAALLEGPWIDPSGQVHDWQEHNGWSSGQNARAYAGRVGAIVKQCLVRGMEPSRYLQVQGGDVAGDALLLADVQRAYDKAVAKRGGAKSGLGRSDAGGNRSGPRPNPTPTPTPNGGGGAGVTPDLPPPGSVVPPPGQMPDAAAPAGSQPMSGLASTPAGQRFLDDIERRRARDAAQGRNVVACSAPRSAARVFSRPPPGRHAIAEDEA